RAGASEVIEGLPAGWDTVLSRRTHGGVELSGGQWQRVALARALLAVDSGASVLILDEPTAALDVRAEATFYDQFLELTAELTTVVISHRFSTVRRADHIVVIDDGQVSESGDHSSLLAADGRYARMFRLQAAHLDSDIDSVGDVATPDSSQGE
ncbi:MAG: ATP-binding cassette domain-containing protein, partial [Pseudonocardiaceae bacterium]